MPIPLNPMNVGIFSGSFNPVHNGHVALADYLLRHTDLDEIWMLVSPQNPLKNPGMADAHVRYEMLRLALKDYSGLVASDYELHLPVPTYTCNTLRNLAADFPQHRFALIMGADNMLVFDRWRDYKYILDNHRIIVYPRPGSDLRKVNRCFRGRMEIVRAPLHNISSTMVRNLVAEGGDIAKLVNTDVADYINIHGLYK